MKLRIMKAHNNISYAQVNEQSPFAIQRIPSSSTEEILMFGLDSSVASSLIRDCEGENSMEGGKVTLAKQPSTNNPPAAKTCDVQAE